MIRKNTKPYFISVIIPVYNDKDGLCSTIESLIKQNFDHLSYEIIIADNGSNDGTKSNALDFQENYPDLIKVVHENEIQGSYAARNKALGIASGNIYCFLDADVAVEKDFLLKIQNRFKNGKVDYLGCHVKMRLVKNTLSAKYNYIHGFNIRHSIEKERYTPTCCLIIRKEVMDQVGNFDHRLEGGGDFEFGERVYDVGFNMDYADDIVVFHPTRWKYSSLISKSKRVCRGNAELAYYYPKKYRYLYRRHFRLKNFLPQNPISYYHRMKDENISGNWLVACLFSIYHLPIATTGTIAAFKQIRKLRFLYTSGHDSIKKVDIFNKRTNK